MLAGSDTTAAAVRCTMLHLMTTPRVYQQLKSVVQQAVKEGVSSPIKQEEAKKIAYLQVRLWQCFRITVTGCTWQRWYRLTSSIPGCYLRGPSDAPSCPFDVSEGGSPSR